MLAEGITWFIGNLQGTGVPLLFALGAWGEALNLAVLAHLLLAFPDGRLATTLDRGVVAVGYGLVAVGGLLRVTLYDPAVSSEASYLSCGDCGPDANALLLWSDPALFDAVDLVYRWAGALLTVVCLVALVRRWRLACPARRRVLMPASVAIAVAVAFVGWEVLYVLAPGALDAANALLTWPSDASQIAVPFAFLVELCCVCGCTGPRWATWSSRSARIRHRGRCRTYWCGCSGILPCGSACGPRRALRRAPPPTSTPTGGPSRSPARQWAGCHGRGGPGRLRDTHGGAGA